MPPPPPTGARTVPAHAAVLSAASLTWGCWSRGSTFLSLWRILLLLLLNKDEVLALDLDGCLVSFCRRRWPQHFDRIPAGLGIRRSKHPSFGIVQHLCAHCSQPHDLPPAVVRHDDDTNVCTPNSKG